MDNCLASNSETGGVGCDNMTMIVIALLQGKSKEEWYQMVADRVSKGEGPAAPPEYGEFTHIPRVQGREGEAQADAWAEAKEADQEANTSE